LSLDPYSYTPYFKQIKDHILGLIQTGQLKENERIPSEMTLSERFGVSRPTVRKALDELFFSGVLWRKQGKGTFVAPFRIEENLMTYTPFAEEVKAMGKQPQIMIISKKIIPAGPEVANQLQLDAENKVIELIGLRKIEDKPVTIRCSYYPMQLFPDIISEFKDNQPVHEIISHYLFTQHSLIPERVIQTFQVNMARDWEAALLSVEKNFPLLIWDGIFFANNQQPFEYCRSYYRSDRYKFKIEQQHTQHPTPVFKTQFTSL
jgi:GntR family transcriptional regulator